MTSLFPIAYSGAVAALRFTGGENMFQKILVPLDGSKLAECTLPYVETLATGCSAEEVILVSVTERVQAYRAIEDPGRLEGQRLLPEAMGKKERQAQKYLGRIAKALEAKGIKVRTEVLLGNPAEEITFYAKHPGCDIIVMASHGRSGPSRWAYGSVADKVFRASCVPVLMVRAPGCTPGV
jgi:nucleotide-binding universal stress UspA family protein